jgi:hypothetical protein
MTGPTRAIIEVDVDPLADLLEAVKAVIDLKAAIRNEMEPLRVAINCLQQALSQFEAAEGRKLNPTVAGTEDDPPR